jgi:dTDP-4-amino-4,6-dideoxygalactose transaminase
MFVPFVDLKTQYYSIKNEIDHAIQNVIDETAFIKGKYVKEFENNFANEYGVKHCIGVANGTDAIYIILKMLNIKDGDEVITVANSWISTSETISQAGAKPVFVDIEPEYFTIDPDQIEKKITTKTRAIIPVHLYGQPASMTKIQTLCNKYKLFLIEDCAQAHFAEYEGRKVGTFGIASSFSFYPGKNLGAYGDAGAIITNDDDLANKMRMYSNHGALVKHNHLIEGINSRLDGLQASILNVKLKYIDQWNQKRLANALLYNKLLKDIKEIKTPVIRNNSKHIFHVYCVRAEKRDELKNYLADNNIETAIHYPVALPNMPAYRYLNHKSTDFPISSNYQSRILSLPMYPELSNQQIKNVVDVIKKFYNYSK